MSTILMLLQKLFSSRNETTYNEPKYLTAPPEPVAEDIPLRKFQEDKLYKALCQRGRHILLYGPGGMGKTHLARKLFYRLRGKYKRMAWINYGSSIRESMTMPQTESASDNPDIRFAEFIRALEEEPDTILFIDDVKETAMDDLVLGQLTGLGITILLTSRCSAVSPYESWNLATVTSRECVDLFYAHYRKDPDRKYRSAVRTLVERMERNIFSMRLLAAVAGEPADLPRMVEVLEEGSLMDHIGQLMIFSGITDSQREILHCLSLMPSSEMQENIIEWLDFPVTELEALVEKGWLIRNPKTKSMNLHDLVREYNNQEQPNRQTLERFLKTTLGEDFCKSAATDSLATFKGKILELQMCAIAHMEKYWDEPRDLADAYDNLGIEFREFGSYHRALKYIKMGLDLRERLYPRDELDLATSYNNVGSVYSDLDEPAEALEYLLKALAIREKVLPEDDLDLANTYNNVGLAYGDLYNYTKEHNRTKELDYLLKALTIREKVLPEDHLLLATSYNNLGTAYVAADDHKMALFYLLKARVILEKLRPGSPELATLYNNLGVIYGKSGNDEEPKTYHLKALEIQEKVLPTYHADFAVTYHNMAKAYQDMKEYVTALYWERKALNIACQSLDENHSNRTIYQEAVEYLEQKTKE